METVTNHVNRSNFVPAADLISRTGFTASQDAQRATAVANLTVMAKDSTGKLIPLTDNTAVDGTQIPVGILRGSIPAADLVAGNVTNVEMYIEGKYFNEDDITLENSLTLASEITVDTYTADVDTADAVEIDTIAGDDAVEPDTLVEDDAVEIATIENADATDLASAQTLVNEIKSALNTYTSAALTTALINEIKTALNTYSSNGLTTTLVNEIKTTLNTYTAAGKTTALVNDLKTAVNTKTGGRTMTIREYLAMIGIFTRTVDAVGGYENS